MKIEGRRVTWKDLPNALDIPKRVHDPWLWFAVAGYFALGTLLVWRLIRPKSALGIVATLAIATVWNVW